jgi:putative hydrolase of the HAD superfamily
LDDTLYDESTFIKSGFKAVAKYISLEYNLIIENEYKKLLVILENQGRGAVFDHYLEANGIFTQNLRNKLVGIYRAHQPKIKMKYQDRRILEIISKKYPTYLVTDGNKKVQESKIKSLNIHRYFKKIFITHHYGIKNAKPSIYCFQKILELEKNNWKELIYVGDNPKKDFINLKKVGAITIRVKQGMYKNYMPKKNFDAEFEINKITELPKIISKLKEQARFFD